MARKYSAMPGSGPVGGAASVARSAVPASPGIGMSESSAGVTVSAIAALSPSKATNIPRLRRASAPALAVATTCTVPVNKSAATNGTIVACSARNQISPTGSLTSSTAGSASGAANASASPPNSPSASAPKVHTAGTCAIGGRTKPDADADDGSLIAWFMGG